MSPITALIRDIEKMRDDGRTPYEAIVDRCLDRLKDIRRGVTKRTPKDVPVPPWLKVVAERAIKVSARYFGVTPASIWGTTRTYTVARARMVAVAAIRKEAAEATLSEIGALFGRNHSTVVHSINRVDSDTWLSNALAIVRMDMREGA